MTAYAALVLSERLHGVRPARQKEPESVQDRIWDQLRKKNKKSKDHPVLGGGW